MGEAQSVHFTGLGLCFKALALAGGNCACAMAGTTVAGIPEQLFVWLIGKVVGMIQQKIMEADRNMEADRLNDIINGLEQKSSTKQAIYRNTKEAFERLKMLSEEVVEELTERITKQNADVVIEYREIGPHEFHIKFSGDLLVFVMHSNVITFPDDYEIMRNPYVESDFRRRFFGHIMAYNFMADTIKYNRLDDTGYLIGRMLVNIENHFVIEGVKQMDLSYDHISKNRITDRVLRIIVESAIIASINNDLMGQAVSDIEKITYKHKLENLHLSRTSKLGFVMNHELTN